VKGLVDADHSLRKPGFATPEKRAFGHGCVISKMTRRTSRCGLCDRDGSTKSARLAYRAFFVIGTARSTRFAARTARIDWRACE